MSANSSEVDRHYGRGGLLGRILAALAEAGKDIERLTIDDLAPVDEFHSRRRRATEELADLLAPTSADHVIDIGSGLGGPSRYLAATYGCRVSGVDLTEEFVATAVELTRRTGLSGLVDFRVGSALDLPFPDASFDLGWTQNVAMNIADRPRYYAEMHRVLKPGARLAIQDVAQGLGGARPRGGQSGWAADVGGSPRGGRQLPREDAEFASELGGGPHAADQRFAGQGAIRSVRVVDLLRRTLLCCAAP